MRTVILESPLAPNAHATLEQNIAYARACLRDALHRGAAPMASHLLYTQPGVLDDTVPAERTLGIAAGFAWRTRQVPTWVYVDAGISAGMLAGIEHARRIGSPVVLRSLRLSQPEQQAPEGWMSLPDARGSQVAVPVLVDDPEHLAAVLGPALVETAD